MSVAIMRKILGLKERKRSNAAIKKLYSHNRMAVQQGAPLATRMRRVNEEVLNRVYEARNTGRPVHGNSMRRWGLESADDLNISREYFSASITWLYKIKKAGVVAIWHGVKLCQIAAILHE